MDFFTCLLIFLLPVVSLVSAADANAWKSRSIYFALTDRIARSSSDNGGSACADLNNYCGGTFKGLESKLDYIQGMGFDAIWITPVVANTAKGYHGYWAQDLYNINSNYGSANDLKSLVSAIHSRGMFIMLDIVVNHMGYDAVTDNRPSPLNDPNSYHASCAIDYSSQTSIEQCRIDSLPDINTQSSTVRSFLQTWVRWLVNEFSVDGLRIDTVKHVEKDFWPPFAAAAGVYSVGEVFDGDPAYLQGYASLLPGLLDYATYYPLNRFYQQTGSSQDLVDMHDRISSTFPDPTALGTFLDNHDNPRWLSSNKDTSLLKNALAFVMLSRGIPIVYYGTEQGFTGANDPGRREDLWRSSFNTGTDLYRAISRLVSARKTAGGLAADDHVHLFVNDTAYAWSRNNGNLVVLTTNRGSGSSPNYCFNTRKPSVRWSNVFGSGTYASDGSGNVCVGMANGEPVVLVAGSKARRAEPPARPSTTLATVVAASSAWRQQ